MVVPFIRWENWEERVGRREIKVLAWSCQVGDIVDIHDAK